jgi:hypothetical protein
MMSVVS